MLPARRMLLAVLNRTTAREIAIRLGVHPSCVYKWVEGETRPRIATRARIAAIYRIPPHAWLTDPTLPRYPRIY